MTQKINKKHIIIFASLVLILFFSKTVFALWDGNFYDPGETLNPECLPTDPNCDVLAPLTADNINDTVYGVGWNGDTNHAPSKNAVYDKIESLFVNPTITTPTFSTNFTSPVWKPISDSTTAIQINKADGVTNILNIDTTNSRVGIGTTSPSVTLDINGDIKANTFFNSTDVKFYGAKGDGVHDDTQAFIDALASSDYVTISTPGTYKLTSTIYIDDNKTIEGVKGVIIKRGSNYSHIFANTKSTTNGNIYNKNITLKNLIINDNNIGTQIGSASPTANGIINFTYLDGCVMDNISIINGDTNLFGVHFQSVTNAKIYKYSYVGEKDGFHINGGSHNIDIDGFEISSYDDTFGIMTDDYPRLQHNAQDISDISIRNGRSYSNNSDGFFIRFLTGSWLNWSSGNTYNIGNTVLNNGNLYKMANSGPLIGSIPPTHTSGDITGSDGIKWRWIGSGNNLNSNIKNITVNNVILEDRRNIWRTINNDSYDYGEYPGTENTSTVDNLKISNVTRTTSPYNDPIIRNSNTGLMGKITLLNVPESGIKISSNLSTNSLYIDGNNNVGIGTKNNSASKLTVQSDAGVGNVVALNLNNPYTYGVGAGTAASVLRFTRSYSDSGSTRVMADIIGGNENEQASTTGYLSLATRNGITETTQERMRITSSGYVGIGTNSPTAQLEITGNFKISSPTNGSLNGIIYKGWAPFIHDFNYGNNGTITTDGGNTFIGIDSGNFTMGSTATSATQSSFNTGIGKSTLKNNTTGRQNVAIGVNSLLTNSSGDYNVSVGTYSLQSNQSGSLNVGIGRSALKNITTGSQNIAIGSSAGENASGSVANQTGNYSVFMGDSTKPLNNGDTNEIVIGYNTTGVGSNSVVLGNDNITKTILRGSVGVNTTNPTSKLTIATATSGDGVSVINSGDNIQASLLGFSNGNGGYVQLNNSSGTAGALIRGYSLSGVGAYINSGNVGIGTSTPNSRLHIKNTGLTYASPTFFSTNAFLIEDAEGTVEIAADDTNNFGSSIFLSNLSTTDGSRKTWGILNKAASSNNRFAISYGTTNDINNYGGTAEKFVIDTSGNVGIGTTSPLAPLNLRFSSSSTYGGVAFSGAQLAIENADLTDNNTAAVSLRGLDSNSTVRSAAQIVAVISGRSATGLNGTMAFTTNNAGTISEKMRITPTGSVGIGTSSPVQLLDVNGRSYFRDTTDWFTYGRASWNLSGATNQFTMYAQTGNRLALGAGGTPEYMTISTTGNVGIGTVNPNTKLEIKSNGNFDVLSVLRSADSTNLFKVRENASGNGEFYMYDSTGNADVIFRTNGDSYITSGNVGIGTATPQTALSFPSASTGISLFNTSDMTTNYERGLLSWSSNAFRLGVASAGTGTLRSVQVGTNLGNFVVNSGTANSFTGPVIDYDINSSSAAGYTAIRLGSGTMSSASSGTFKAVLINPGISQSGSAAYTALTVNAVETTTGSGTKLLQDWQLGGSSKVVITSTGNLGIGTNNPLSKLEIGSSDLGDGSAGPAITLGRNTNATNSGAGSINFLSKNGTAGHVWQDVAGNMRISTSAPSTSNDVTGTVIGTQTSTRETKQDINDYTDYTNALNMIVNAPLHTFKYIKEVEGYGIDSPLAKTRIGYIADEVDPMFMWGNTIDQVSVNGLLIASIKELNLKINKINDFEKENDWRDSLTAWFANATNRITRIFTGEVCLTSPGEEPVCLNSSELKSLKGLINQSNSGGGSVTQEIKDDTTTKDSETIETNTDSSVIEKDTKEETTESQIKETSNKEETSTQENTAQIEDTNN